MEITKELREKLLTANSEEEVKALLGDEVTAADAAFVWEKLQAKKDEGALEALDDDELEAVSGGYEEAANGHEVGCDTIFWYSDWKEANEKCCAENSEGGWYHDFKKVREFYRGYVLLFDMKCKYCGYTKTINPGFQG